MRKSLDSLEKVVVRKPGDPGGDPVGKGPSVHIMPDDGDGSDDRSTGKIRKIDGPIQSHDEMVDGSKDHGVLDGSDDKHTKETKLTSLKDVKENAVRETKKQIQSGVGRGGMSGTSIVETIDIQRMDYKQILRSLFSLSAPSGKRAWNVADRRRPGAIPGRIPEDVLNSFMLALDTSGSITPAMISRFIGTAQQLAQEYVNDYFSIRIVLYTEQVYKVQDFTGSQIRTSKFPEWLRTNIDKTGGNYFSDVAKTISSMRDIKRFKGIVYLTDGEEAWDPDGFKLPPVKNIFLIEGNNIDLGNNSRHSTQFINYVRKQKPGGQTVDVYQINI